MSEDEKQDGAASPGEIPALANTVGANAIIGKRPAPHNGNDAQGSAQSAHAAAQSGQGIPKPIRGPARGLVLAIPAGLILWTLAIFLLAKIL